MIMCHHKHPKKTENTCFSSDYARQEQRLIWSTENQITPFNLTTPDNEVLYAWHVLPLGLYAKNEPTLLREPSGCAVDITKTAAFALLRDDPEARLIISCEFSHVRSASSIGY